MIDLHTHILPEIDDGSQSVAESVEMLRMLKAQGIGTVVATPHFEVHFDTPASFLERRNAAFNELNTAAEGLDLPAVIPGAEVAYFWGISRMEGLSDLRIAGTRLLLVEMPFTKWTDGMVKEIIGLASFNGFKVVLAHVERYLKLVRPRVLKELALNGVYMQINASFINDGRTRRRALKMLKRGNVQFLGSDAHGAIRRPPELGSAVEIVKKKLGQDYIMLGCELFNKFKI